jgi:site-specific recombinase XerD
VCQIQTVLDSGCTIGAGREFIVRDCDLINEFADFLRYARHRAERTIESYRSDIEQFLSFLETDGVVCSGDVVNLSQDSQQVCTFGGVVSILGNVCTDKVRAFMDYLHDRQYSQASVRRKLAALICLYDFLCSKKLLDFNPTTNVRVPESETDRHRPRTLTDEQIYKLLHLPNVDTWLGIRDKAMLELLCSTGIRVSELASLNVNDIDTDKYTLRIASQSGKTRLMPITTVAAESVGDYLRLRPSICLPAESLKVEREEKDDNALFINKFGKRLDTRSADRRIEKYIEMAELGRSVSPYDLRHSFAKKMLDNGANVEQLRQNLGFESTTSARSYADVLRSESMELQQTFLANGIA